MPLSPRKSPGVVPPRGAARPVAAPAPWRSSDVPSWRQLPSGQRPPSAAAPHSSTSAAPAAPWHSERSRDLVRQRGRRARGGSPRARPRRRAGSLRPEHVDRAQPGQRDAALAMAPRTDRRRRASAAPRRDAGRRCAGPATCPMRASATTARTRTRRRRPRGTASSPVAAKSSSSAQPIPPRRARARRGDGGGARPGFGQDHPWRVTVALAISSSPVATRRRTAPGRRARSASASSARTEPARPGYDVGTPVGRGWPREPRAATRATRAAPPRRAARAARAAAHATPSEPAWKPSRRPGGIAGARATAWRSAPAAVRRTAASPVTTASCARNRPTPAVPS